MKSHVVTTRILFYMSFILLFFSGMHLSAQEDTQPEIDSLTILFEKSNDLEEKKSLLKALSNLYDRKGNWEKYEEIVQQMLLLQEEKQDSFYLAQTYNKLGISNSCMGKNEEAINYFQKALEINTARRDPANMSDSYENMAAAYKDMGKYTDAVECLLKSLEIRKEKKHSRIFNNYMKLAVLQQLLDDLPKQDYYIKLAKQELNKKEIGTPANMAIFNNELGSIYETREMYDSCFVCYKNVIFYSKQIGWNRGIAEGLGNLADAYSMVGLLDSAVIYHKQSLRLSEEIQDCIGASQECLYLAELFQKVNKNDSVLFFANEALRKANECNMLREKSLALKFIAEFYKSQHNFLQAYNFLQQHYAVQDSIASSDVKSNIAELETKYQTKVKEQQIELLTAENQIKNQRIRLAVLFIGLLVIIVFLVLILLYFRRKQAFYKQSELQQQLLRSQMNPHFIFNVMGSIQSYLYKNEANKAAEYLGRFASLSRSILEYSSQEAISLKNEIETLQNYIELERARMEEPFEVVYEVDETMEIDFIEIPPMLIQPFVENAIKHGLKELDYPGKLRVRFAELGDFIEIEIEDNGKGLEQGKVEGHQSKALAIFKQRKKGIEHRFKKEIIFELIDKRTLDLKQHGVMVHLRLPILNND
ncbi:MAG: histidine kinase [Prolixibacteraceae bacterium]